MESKADREVREMLAANAESPAPFALIVGDNSVTVRVPGLDQEILRGQDCKYHLHLQATDGASWRRYLGSSYRLSVVLLDAMRRAHHDVNFYRKHGG